jgi:hypothetical protein
MEREIKTSLYEFDYITSLLISILTAKNDECETYPDQTIICTAAHITGRC